MYQVILKILKLLRKKTPGYLELDGVVQLNGVPVKIGKHTYGINYLSVLVWDDPISIQVEIGRYCSISFGCKIFTGGNHRFDWVSTYPFGHIGYLSKKVAPVNGQLGKSKPVIIGNDVWIGRDVTIMSGVTIGDGAVIAANSHVVKNVKPYTIVGGNPAMEIKARFDETTIDTLLKIKWWLWDDEKVVEMVPLLCGNVDSFTKALIGE